MIRIVRGTAFAALALTAAAAQAQSAVTMYGLVDVGAGRFDRFNLDDPTPFEKVTKLEPGMMTTSFIGFRGEEDLGGGLKAQFKLEAFLRADTGLNGRFTNDTFWARSSSVGLSSPAFGAVNLGRTTPPLFVSTILFNPFGDSYVWSPTVLQIYNLTAGGQLRGDSGWNNSVQYNSPNWGGLTVNVALTAGEGFAGPTGTGKNVGVNALYFGGPLSATVAYQRVENASTGGEHQKTWMVGGAFDAGFAKFFGQVARIDDEDISGAKDKLFSVGASVKAGPGNVLVAYGQNKIEAAGDSTKRKTGTLGYNYQLSKRTDITAAVMRDEQEAGGIVIFQSAALVAAPEGKGTSYGVNIRHKF